MARNETLNLPADEWTEITNADATSITFMVQSPNTAIVYIQATAASEPSGGDGDVSGSIPYAAGQGERNATIADMFPGVAGADRVFAHPVGVAANLFVSHA